MFEAARDTFSGERPCALCCKIAAARQGQNNERAPLLPVSVGMKATVLKEILPVSLLCLQFPKSSSIDEIALPDLINSPGRGAAEPPTLPPRNMG